MWRPSKEGMVPLDAELYTWEPAPRAPLPAVLLPEFEDPGEVSPEEREQQLKEYEAARENADAAQDALDKQEAAHEQTMEQTEEEIEAAKEILGNLPDNKANAEAREAQERIKEGL